LENKNSQLMENLNYLENELKKKNNDLNALKCENNQLKNVVNSRINNNIIE
jgi:hypothetical protein